MRSFSLKSLASISTLLTFTTMLALTTGTANAKTGKSIAAAEHGARTTHSLRGDEMGGRQPIPCRPSRFGKQAPSARIQRPSLPTRQVT
jgi:hypothetical protein